MGIQQNRKAKIDQRPKLFFRTLNLLLDAMVEKQWCEESELNALRAIAAQLDDTKRQIDALIGNRRDIPIPPEIQKFGCFMTAAGGIHYAFLKQVWAAESPAKIQELSENAVRLARKCAGNGAETA
jgi:hypothetical protein